MKKWNTPCIDELDITSTASGDYWANIEQDVKLNSDGDYVSVSPSGDLNL